LCRRRESGSEGIRASNAQRALLGVQTTDNRQRIRWRGAEDRGLGSRLRRDRGDRTIIAGDGFVDINIW
jgi:hypothetical protein